MYSFNEEVNSEGEPENASTMMTTCMATIHDMLMEPMQGKLTPEEDGVLALVGLTLKIIGEKAHSYEKMENGEIPDPTKNDFFRN